MPVTGMEVASYKISGAVRKALEDRVAEQKATGERARIGEAVEEAIWMWLRGGSLYAKRNKRCHTLLEAILESKLPGMRDMCVGALTLLGAMIDAGQDQD